MADVREAILARLLAIGESLAVGDEPIFKTAVRNRGLTDQDQRPRFSLLDGTESARLTSDRRGRGGARGIGPQLMTMRPEIYFLAKEPRPTAQPTGSTENVGSDLNAMRLAYLTAVEMDSPLRSLIGPNGEIQLTSTDTDMKNESPGLGQMRLDFAITYVLNVT